MLNEEASRRETNAAYLILHICETKTELIETHGRCLQEAGLWQKGEEYWSKGTET